MFNLVRGLTMRISLPRSAKGTSPCVNKYRWRYMYTNFHELHFNIPSIVASNSLTATRYSCYNCSLYQLDWLVRDIYHLCTGQIWYLSCRKDKRGTSSRLLKVACISFHAILNKSSIESADEQIKLSLAIESLCYNTSSFKENKCKLILNKTQ